VRQEESSTLLAVIYKCNW